MYPVCGECRGNCPRRFGINLFKRDIEGTTDRSLVTVELFMLPMFDGLVDFLTQIVSFRTDRMLFTLCCLLGIIFLAGYSRLLTAKHGKLLFRIGIGGLIIGCGLTVGLSVWKMRHGLSAQYYPNPQWVEDHDVELERYFEPGGRGRRTDRFINFSPNDFHDRYPFSGQAFSVIWQGYVYAPAEGYTPEVASNFGIWLYLDEALATGPHRIDFGASEARSYLREGWSRDELWADNPDLSFLWSSGSRSMFYLGVDERSEYDLYVRCLPFLYEGSPAQELTVSIDGAPIDTITLAPEWKTYRIPVPESVLPDRGPGFFQVRFTYSNVVRPAEILEHSNEQRQLAVAFDFAYLQKADNHKPVVAREALGPPQMSKGFHQITLKAIHKPWDNPFIQLRWRHNAQKNAPVIPEDYLFPLAETIPTTGFLKERFCLGIALLYKSLLILILGIGVFRYIFPPYAAMLLKREHLLLCLMCLFAFGIRLWFLIERRRVDPNFYILPDGTDHLTYVFFARGFFRGYWPGLTYEPFFQAPLISFYFIVCSILFGESLLAWRIVSAAIATISLAVTFFLARRLFDRTVAYIAAGLWAVNGVLILYDTSLVIAPLLLCLNMTTLWLIHKFRERLSLRLTLSLGIIMGLTALARANIFLLMPFLLVWMFLVCPGTVRRKIIHYSVLCLVILLTIVPVTLRNYFSDPERPLVLTNTNGGITFWIGNNPSSTGTFEHSSALHDEVRHEMKATGQSYADMVVRYITEHPLDYLRLEWQKFVLFWRGYEIGNNLQYYWSRMQSGVLQFPWVNFVLIGPLGIVGMGLAIKQWKKLFVVYGFVVIQILTTLLFFALTRYRLPVVPVLSIFAAYAVVSVIKRIRQRDWGTSALLIGCFLALYVMLNYAYAAELYQAYHGAPMPWTRLFRYWDLFFIYHTVG